MRTHLSGREIGGGQGGWVKSAEVKKGVTDDRAHLFPSRLRVLISDQYLSVSIQILHVKLVSSSRSSLSLDVQGFPLKK
jgi:hypothetical protein